MENRPTAEAAPCDPWLAHFADRGHPGVRRIGAGVEGVVYGLGEGRVAKVWNGRPPAGLALTRRVYADLARHHLPFATPEIFEVEDHGGVLVTYERELPGGPMRVDSAHAAYERELSARHTDTLLSVLRGLASVPGTDAMRGLTVQGDDRPLWRDHDRFRDALAALVDRAAARHGAALAAHVPDFEAGVERTRKALRALPDAPVTAIHGDLVPPNIHVDEAGRPVAVLDFGFCTTAGDPAFEAAVTAAVWDMYGPHAEAHAAELTGLFARELGYAPATLTTYQAAYALTTYDLFGLDERDGHFRWCAQQLRRNPLFSA
ncbi:aminoglycoside phosphotransferase family protein [Streptomyces sp. NBC_00193]|uniref:phosphotransferase family protein n=1 Tax=unclassified Streptomyces TaxID=2593676 RepID=UPI0022523208|nr:MULTISPECIES: aminoglycoside phosphotransferase family protein [unclassified Streptomyces]MCX5127498.1 aminoglycoside phosphotransferase family protein [Streptomyces sp. NBC_00347]MCX5295081.1 aminoglycoside phosphotransferase family protein [Streptomyces sp. NBC_00193]